MWTVYDDFCIKVKLFRTGEDEKKQSDDPTLGLNDERMQEIVEETVEAINNHLKQYHEEGICADYGCEQIYDADIISAPDEKITIGATLK